MLIGLCASVDAAPSLDILKAVDVTVDSLAKVERYLDGVARIGSGLIETIKTTPGECPIDESDFCVSVFEKAEENLRSIYAYMTTCTAHAKADPRLNGDHEESVVEQYQMTMKAVEVLHDTFRDLRWAILEHNASEDDNEGEAYADADALLAELHS